MDRRTFLGGLGLTAAGGLAGCTGAADEESGVRLPRVELINASTTDQTFHVIVKYDGEIAHWDSYDVESRYDEEGTGSMLVNPGIDPEPGHVSVHTRVDDEESEIDFDREGYGDGECVLATFTYGFRGDDQLTSYPELLEDGGEVVAGISCP